jgi:hypothetical protein
VPGKRYRPLQRLAETMLFVGLLGLAGYWIALQIAQAVDDQDYSIRGGQLFRLGMIAFPLLIVVLAVRDPRLALHTLLLYPDRLVCIRKQGLGWTFLTYRWGQLLEQPGEIITCRFDAIASIQQTASQLTLHRRRGPPIVLGSDWSLRTDDFATVANTIQQKVKHPHHEGGSAPVEVPAGQRDRPIVRKVSLTLLFVLLVGVYAAIFSLNGSCTQAAFSPNDRLLATGCGDTISVRDLVEAKPAQVLRGHRHVVFWAVVFSADGGRVAAGADDGFVQVWELEGGQRTFACKAHGEAVEALAFHPEGGILATASDDGLVKFWDLASRNALRTLAGHAARVSGVAFSPDGTRLASASWLGTQAKGPEVIVWNVADGRRLLTIPDSGNCVAYSPDGRRLLVGGKHPRVCDSAHGHTIFAFDGHQRPVSQVVVSRDGRRFASVNDRSFKGSSESHIRVWDAATGQLQCTFSTKPAQRSAIEFDQAGKTLRCVDAHGDLKAWSADTGQPLPPP